MNGLIEGIKFSDYTIIDVIVIEDYHVKGSFHPDAASDIDYFGYRDTDFFVHKAYGVDKLGTFEFTQDEISNLVENNYDKLMLCVQNAIDNLENDND